MLRLSVVGLGCANDSELAIGTALAAASDLGCVSSSRDGATVNSVELLFWKAFTAS